MVHSCFPVHERCISKFNKHVVDPETPSEEWILQMALQTKRYTDPSKKRVMVMDNFYTWHVLVHQVSNISDGEIKVIGTVRFNNIDGANRKYVKDAIQALNEDGVVGCSWFLFQEYDRGEVCTTVSKNVGCIVFKDQSVVTFYTNDLAYTPPLPIQ